MDIDTLLDEADFPTRTVTICLKASLRARWAEEVAALQQLRAEQATAREKGNQTQGADRDISRQEAKVADLEAKVREHAVDFVLEALPTADYNALLIKHPPREDNVSDRVFGFNTVTFFPVAIRASLKSPALSDAQYDKLLTRLTDAQFDRLAEVVVDLNRGQDGSIPFSSAASAPTPGSGETSSSPAS